MPEIKNTFLAGKMNKSLDDRLLPEGEYRDALNIQVTKNDADDGENVGVVHNIRGNSLEASVSGYTNPKIIGSFFNDQNNTIYFFVTDNTNHGIYSWQVGDENPTAINTGSFLNFNKSRLITGINVIENVLFWTDNYNEPRKIYLDNNDINYNINVNLSILKPAPFKAPEITSSSYNSNNSDFIKEKFARFAYRYKFKDGSYSVFSPFSQIAFTIDTGETITNELTDDQLSAIYKKGIIDQMVNSSNEFELKIYLPSNSLKNSGELTIDDINIDSIDVLMKTSDSPAVNIIDTLSNLTATTSAGNISYITYTYKSTKPKSTLPEQQLTRVYDDGPTKALAQEIVGNRVVYGNFTLNIPTPADNKLSFTVSTATNSSQALGLKLKRSYEVGIVLSDAYGRTSTVLTSRENNGIIYLDTDASPEYDADLLKKLTITFTDLSEIQGLNPKWLYYSVVVKQASQEYYNIYLPGFGSYQGKTYATLFGDNINKLPIDTSTYNTETSISSTNVKVYLSLENKSYFIRTIQSGLGQQVYAVGYRIQNSSGSNSTISNYTPKDKSNFTVGSGGQQDFIITRTFDSYFGDMGASGVTMASSPIVYVNGILSSATANNSTNTVSLTTAAVEGDIVEIFPTYNNVIVYPYANRVGYSLTQPTAGANVSVAQSGDSLSVDIYVEGVDALNEDYIYDIYTENPEQKQLNEVKVTGISTLNNFNSIPDEIKNTSYDLYETTFYKKQNNYRIVEFDSEFGVKLKDVFSGTLNGITYTNDLKGKIASLSILETQPFESSIDIFFETPTQGLIEDIDSNPISINYYNCINFKINNIDVGFQESTIKGGYNEPSIDNGVQAYFVNEKYQEQVRSSSLIYSGIINPRTGVDNTNQFPSGDQITRSLDPSYGSIQKLYADTEDLLIFQEEKVSQALIDKDIIYTAEGQGLTTAGQRVISQINSYGTNYGIGTNPESFAVYAGRKYFVDKPKGAVLRLSRDGITEISNYGMRGYFRDNLKNASTIVGSWDMYNKDYILTLDGSINKSIAFDESSNGWTSFFSFVPDCGGSLDGNYYTLKGDEIWLHNSTSADFCTFYGGNSDGCYVDIVFNQNPSANKNFLTINYEGSNTWNIEDIITDSDFAEDIVAYNILNEDLIISGFKKYDNKYYANIFNKNVYNDEDENTVPYGNEINFGGDVSGIKGYFAKMRIKTDATDYKELFSVSTNYNINSY